jgi:hypothetical protein
MLTERTRLRSHRLFGGIASGYFHVEGLGPAAARYYISEVAPPLNASISNPGIRRYQADMSVAERAGIANANLTGPRTGLKASAGMIVIQQELDEWNVPKERFDPVPITAIS